MNLAVQLLQQIDDPTFNHQERAQLRCRLAKELEEAGNYEAARSAIGELWQRIGDRPKLDGLDQRTAAELLLRAGALSGWIGSAKQIEGAQEIAKNLISESAIIFEALQETEKVAEAQIDLAICYWREGAFDEARVTLREVLNRIADEDSEQKARALLNSAMVERVTKHFSDALRISTEAAPLFEASSNHALKGRFYAGFATLLKNLGAAENRQDYIDRALVEYAAASFHFEQAGHTRYRASVENNLGFLFSTAGKFTEAHEHLDRARRLFVSLKDSVHTAQVDETRARAFLGEGRNREAEKVARSAVNTLEKGDEHSLLAEALTTYAVALARLEHQDRARVSLERAMEVAEQAGDIEGAGMAALTMIEELDRSLTPDEMSAVYERADDLLARTQHPGTPVRLRRAARRVLAARQRRAQEFSAPDFVHATGETAELLQRAHRIAVTGQTVLITGETGTGKCVLARLIHEWSGRNGQFVPLNCVSLSDTLIESQLFGHRKGSFTGAVEDYPGVVRMAAGGTLFLDEIGELSIGNQGKLLRLIEQGEVHSLGAPEPERLDLRIIAATNRDLKEQVRKGLFREDLFYRLQTFHLEIPPLRARTGDIPVLAEHFIRETLESHHKRVTFTSEAIEAMRRLHLRGNARELRSLIERTVLIAAEGATITAEAIERVSLRQTQKASFANPWEDFSLKEEVRRFEGRFVELALKDAKGRISHAAKLLGFKHHESLRHLLESRHKDLRHARTPATPRRRSIIPKHLRRIPK